jgi:hypothetical protein
MTLLRSLVCILIFCCSALSGRGAVLSGRVTDAKGEALPFVNVFIKGTTKGTTTNKDGYYTLELAPGPYEVSYKMIGYKLHTEKVSMTDQKLAINVMLYEESFMLDSIVIGDGEDPAYRVIRAAIKKRKYYLEQVDKYSCDVYIKGLQRIIKHPKKIMGMEIDPEGEIDTTTGIIYLSESVSKFNFKQAHNIKEEMISSKVSGDNKAFSYNRASDMMFNFYENLIEVDGLSERGFVSPISNNALFFYKYKMIGAFYENGELINKIEVLPKRKNDPVFHGYIYIIEKSWRIHSTELYLTKDAQIDFVDTLLINQVFLPVDKDTWMVFQNKFVFNFGVLGIKGAGVYVGVNANYNMNPDFPKKFFNGEEMKVNDDANKKDSAYWKDTRPVPLTKEEESDYHKRDSLSKIHNSKPYLDSVDRRTNRPTFGKIFIGGYTYYQRYKKRTWDVSPLIQDVQFNTVQGLVAGLQLSMNKELERNRSYNWDLHSVYGFSNTHFNASGSFFYRYKPEKFGWITLDGGLATVQFNDANPIAPLINTGYTLLDKNNYMKLYERASGQITHHYELVNGLMSTVSVEFSDRMPLLNTTDYTLVKKSADYTSNDPVFPMNDSMFAFKRNQNLEIGVSFRIRFKQKYYTRPNQKIITGSKYPGFTLEYKKSIPGIFGSDMDYDLARIAVRDEVKLGLFGTSKYYVSYGMFLNTNKMTFMDYHHFNGNLTYFSSFALQNFNLLPYYEYSTRSSFLEAHYEHNFGGFILNKFPLIRKLKLHEVVGIHYISSRELPQYMEVFVGIEKLRVIRIDFVTAFAKDQQVAAGIRLGLKFNNF